MADDTYFEDVQEGEWIPEQSASPDPRQLFFFSSATYNGHRIHFDRQWAVDVEGYPDLLVQGPLQAALMAKSITDWMGPRGRLVRFAFQNRASAFPGEELRFRARVARKREEGGAAFVDLELRGDKADAETIMPGSATVSLPRRSARV